LNPNEDNFELVIAAAMNCDKSFLRGYWKEREAKEFAKLFTE